MNIDELINGIVASIKQLDALPTDERIEAINRVMHAVGEIHPNADPVSKVIWVPVDMVEGNSYNPNSVMPPEMRLLYLSIKEDGYTQPTVVYYDAKRGRYILVDGYHRSLICKKYRDIRERTHGYLPVVVIEKSLAERMASTVRHNRARGEHSVTGMVGLVVELVNAGLSDIEVGKQLGMDADEVLRLKRNSGIPDLFKHRTYSRSWVLDPERSKEEVPTEQEDPQQEETLWT